MSRKKVLIVDDSKVTRRSISILLEKQGFIVLALDNVEELFNIPDRYNDVDLMFLDIDLPGMDGLTALEYIHQLPSLNHIPVIIISGHSNAEIVRKAVSLNVIDYVVKPYMPHKLLAKIEQVFKPTESEEEQNTIDTSNIDDDKNKPE